VGRFPDIGRLEIDNMIHERAVALQVMPAVALDDLQRLFQ